MGYSIRASVKQRYRTVKRQRVKQVVDAGRLAENKEKLAEIMGGERLESKRVVNAFKYPENPESEFPQHEEHTVLDFRSEVLPMAGFAKRGMRRKFDDAELEAIEQKKLEIPAAEAERLGMDIPMDSEAADANEEGKGENMFAAAIVDGVKRSVIKPESKKRKHTANRARFVTNGTKKNKAAKTAI